MPTALITGITGQDGQFLAEFLHDKGYEVFGMVKGQNNPKGELVQDELPFVELVSGDLQDLPSLVTALEYTQPDEVYNLGAISFVAHVVQAGRADRQHHRARACCACSRRSGWSAAREDNPIRFYQASSSEMFGKVRETPQNELTPFHPRSPYGCAKVFGHDITVNYRESYGLFACSRHPVQPRVRAARPRVRHPQGHQRRRPHQARPAGRAGARRPRPQARLGLRRRLRRGHVGDAPAGRARRLRGRHRRDAQRARSSSSWPSPPPGSTTGARYVRQDPRFFRPAEVDLLVGDATKARDRLGWQPEVDFPSLVERMVRPRPQARDGQGSTPAQR